jgi:hypothetical protein
LVFIAGKRLERLKDALPRKFSSLRTLRATRARFLTVAAGALYPHKVSAEHEAMKDILNLMVQAERSYTIALAGERPQFMATARGGDPQRDAFADKYANALNLYAKHMRLEEAMQECVRNAFYSLGIAKVYRADSEAVMLEADEWADPGKPFVSSLSPHHFCYDTDATHFRHCSFLTDRYRVRVEDVISEPRYKSSLRNKIKDVGEMTPGQLRGQEWSMSLGSTEGESFDPQMYLADIFLPKEGVLATMVVDDQFNIIVDEPLAEQEWVASETGPYRFLNLGEVPDQTVASAPAQHLFLLHNLINSLYRKLQDGAMSLKDVFVGAAGDAEDLKAVKSAEPLDYLALQNPDAVKQLRLGGPDQNLFAFTLNSLEQFDTLAGNIKHKLGLGAMADTAAQEGMMGANVSRVEADTQAKFSRFARSIGRELGRLLFEDTNIELPTQREIYPGNSVPDPWKGAVEEGGRLGEFSDYDLDLEPFSMAYKSPEQKVGEMDQQFQMVLPILPLLQQQGTGYDVVGHFKRRGELIGNDYLGQMFMPIPPPEEQGGEGPSNPSPGGGEYIHRSVSDGGGEQQQDPLAMMQAASADNAGAM